MYRVLARLWHPDGGTVKDDTRIKTINLAFEHLKEFRGMV